MSKYLLSSTLVSFYPESSDLFAISQTDIPNYFSELEVCIFKGFKTCFKGPNKAV